jgi:hypothetical protein
MKPTEAHRGANAPVFSLIDLVTCHIGFGLRLSAIFVYSTEYSPIGFKDPPTSKFRLHLSPKP